MIALLFLLLAFLVVASFAGLAGRGHPKGLVRLYFIEMWERLGFYTMVGILLLYTIDTETGGLGLKQVVGNEIYGLYLAFVYFTPYLGGLIADRWLGYRRSVLIGGLLFSGGYFLMSIHGQVTFVSGLVMLCVGNGFFKPNISVMVGNLYEQGDPKRDAGFNIFYMGINIGAFFANYLAAILRNSWGWSAVFLGASLGMLIGVGVLIISWKTLARADRQPERDPQDVSFTTIFTTILLPAFVAGIAGYFLAKEYLPEGHALRPAVCGFLLGMAPIVFFFIRLGVKAKPNEKPGLLSLLPIYVAGGTFFMVLHLNGSAMTSWAKFNTDRRLTFIESTFTQRFFENALPEYYHTASPDNPRPNKRSLLVIDSPDIAAMCGQKRLDEQSLQVLQAALQPGDSVFELGGDGVEPGTEDELDLWGVDVFADGEVTIEESPDSHGVITRTVATAKGAKKLKRIVILRDLNAPAAITTPASAEPEEGEPAAPDTGGAEPEPATAESPEPENPEPAAIEPAEAEPASTEAPASMSAAPGDAETIPLFVVDTDTFRGLYEGYREKYGKEPVELEPGIYMKVANSELFQSLNALFVVAFTPLVIWFFGWTVKKGWDFSTARKILVGLILTTLSLLIMVVAGLMFQGEEVRVSFLWLVGFYAVITAGELCLSPMALSLVTKLTPRRLVGLTMGGWFLATAFGNNFSGFFGGIQSRIPPVQFFLLLSGICAVIALFILVLLPKLDAAIKQHGA